MSAKNSKPFWLCFFLCMLASACIYIALHQSREHSQQHEIRYLTLAYSKDITDIIYELLFKTEALATLVVQGNGSIGDFDKIAPVILNKPAIRNILLAPDGVVSHVFPLVGNEKLVGYDLLDDGPGHSEALLAKNSGRLTLGGPFQGVQASGNFLVGRLPVYLSTDGTRGSRRKFWGLVSVTLNFPEVLDSLRLADLEKQGFACEIWRINPDTQQRETILKSGSPVRHPVERAFNLLNATWNIAIAPTEVWYTSPFFYSFGFAAIFISLLLSLSVQNYRDMKNIKCSMEKMAMEDTLTALPNRRAAFEQLRQRPQTCRRAGDSFALVYFDLNRFKEINDTYGHQTGDAVLQEASRRLRDGLGESAFLARIGGDEFIAIVDGMVGGRQALEAHFANLKAVIREPFLYKGNALHFSVSIGYAIYPTDCTDLDQLNTLADKAMYADKEKEHQAMDTAQAAPA